MPVADYTCLSRKCRSEDNIAPTYELPLGSVRCPVCSSKRLQRIYSAPMVNTHRSEITRLDKFVRPGLEAAEAPRLQAQDDRRTKKILPSFQVDPANVGRDLASTGMHPALAQAWGQRLSKAGKAEPKGPITDPVVTKYVPGRPNIIGVYNG